MTGKHMALVALVASLGVNEPSPQRQWTLRHVPTSFTPCSWNVLSSVTRGSHSIRGEEDRMNMQREHHECAAGRQ